MLLRNLFFAIILVIANSAWAISAQREAGYHSVTSAWQAPFVHVSLSKKDWLVSHPATDRILLEHKSKKFTILVVEYGSTLSTPEANLYFNKNFKRDAVENRSRTLSFDSSVMRNVEAEVAQMDGQTYGTTHMTLVTPKGEVQFAERIWVEEERVWQVSISASGPSYENAKQVEQILDDVMDDVRSRPAQTASLLKTSCDFASADAAIVTRAPASEAVRANQTSSSDPSVGDVPLFPRPTGKDCALIEIDDSKRGTEPYEIKFTSGSAKSCLVGGEEAVKKWAGGIKQAFIAGVESIENHAEENLRKHPCEAPSRPSGFLGWMTYSTEMQSYNSCLNKAGTLAVVQSGRDLVVSTAKGISALVNYVRSIDDPVALATAYLQKEVKGFMCLNADTQLAAVCEFFTHVAGVFLGTAATAGAGTAITAGSEVALAARSTLALQAGLKAARDLMISPVTVPIAAARVAVRAPIVATRVATEGVRGLAERVAAAQAIRLSSKTDFDNILSRLSSYEGKLDDFKKSLAAEGKLSSEETRLLNGRVDAADKKLKEMREAYGPLLAQETGEKAKTLALISNAETMGISRAKIEAAMKDGLQCKIR